MRSSPPPLPMTRLTLRLFPQAFATRLGRTRRTASSSRPVRLRREKFSASTRVRFPFLPLPSGSISPSPPTLGELIKHREATLRGRYGVLLFFPSSQSRLISFISSVPFTAMCTVRRTDTTCSTLTAGRVRSLSSFAFPASPDRSVLTTSTEFAVFADLRAAASPAVCSQLRYAPDPDDDEPVGEDEPNLALYSVDALCVGNVRSCSPELSFERVLSTIVTHSGLASRTTSAPASMFSPCRSTSTSTTWPARSSSTLLLGTLRFVSPPPVHFPVSRLRRPHPFADEFPSSQPGEEINVSYHGEDAEEEAKFYGISQTKWKKDAARLRKNTLPKFRCYCTSLSLFPFPPSPPSCPLLLHPIPSTGLARPPTLSSPLVFRLFDVLARFPSILFLGRTNLTTPPPIGDHPFCRGKMFK